MLLTVAEDKCDSGELDLTGIDDEELDKVKTVIQLHRKLLTSTSVTL